MSNVKTLPTKELLHELFSYKDGLFIWEKELNARAPIGTVAGYADEHGYRHIRIMGKRYSLHRLVWVYFHGFLEEKYSIDHIDRNPANNRIENLRKVTHWQNHSNRKFSVRNTSGYTGVTWYEPTKRWFAYITRNHKHISLGYHKDILDAAKARIDAERRLDTFKV